MCTGGHGAGGRREEELGEKYRRIHTAMRETASGERLYSTGSSAQARRVAWRGGRGWGLGGRSKREGMYIYIYIYMYIYTLPLSCC